MRDLFQFPLSSLPGSGAFRIVLIIGLTALGLASCNRERPESKEDRDSGIENRESAYKSGVDVQDEHSRTDQVEAITKEDLRNQLDEYLRKFSDEVDWQYGEREAGSLEGIWQSHDGNGRDIVFWRDGRFVEDFAGEKAQGIYAVSRDGRVAAVSQTSTGFVSSHFRIDGDRLIGPDGPLPSVVWQRIGPPRE